MSFQTIAEYRVLKKPGWQDLLECDSCDDDDEQDTRNESQDTITIHQESKNDDASVLTCHNEDDDDDALMTFEPTPHELPQWTSSSQLDDADYHPLIGTQPFDKAGLRYYQSDYIGLVNKIRAQRRCSTPTSSTASSKPMSMLVRSRNDSLQEPQQQYRPKRLLPSASNQPLPITNLQNNEDDKDDPDVGSLAALQFTKRRKTTPALSTELLNRPGNIDQDEEHMVDEELMCQIGWPQMFAAWELFKNHWHVNTTPTDNRTYKHRPRSDPGTVVNADEWKKHVNVFKFEIMWKLYCRYGDANGKKESDVESITYSDLVILGVALRMLHDSTFEDDDGNNAVIRSSARLLVRCYRNLIKSLSR